MIDFVKDSDYPGVLNLWREAFADSEEFIFDFFKNYKDTILAYKENGELLSMLSIMPVAWGNKKGRYIYAVATDKKARSRGLSTALLEAAKKYILKNGEEFLVLLPQNESLYEFYKKRGFHTKNCIKKYEVLKSEIQKSEENSEKITEDEYYNLRKKFIGNNLIEWSNDDLNNIKNFYNGEFLRSKNKESAAFLVKEKNTLYIKELLSEDDNIAEFVNGYDFDKVIVTKKGNAPYIMVWPEIKEDVYFNIVID